MTYVNDPDLVRRLASMCRDPGLRIVGEWEQGHPSRWFPHEVTNPVTGDQFTDAEAWELIADLLETHHALKAEELRAPPGNTAFVLVVTLGDQGCELYVKITLSRTGKKIIGRSFHVSDR